MPENNPSIIRLMLLLGGYLQKTGNRISSEFDLNQQQFVVLHEIVRKQQICQKDLVGELLFEKSNISKIVKKLQTTGLIAITRPKDDLRTTLLSVTEKGIKTHEACLTKLKIWDNTFLQRLSEEEKQAFHQTLKQLAHGIADGSPPSPHGGQPTTLPQGGKTWQKQ